MILSDVIVPLLLYLFLPKKQSITTFIPPCKSQPSIAEGPTSQLECGVVHLQYRIQASLRKILTIDWIDKPYQDVKLLSTPERKEDEDEFDEGDEYDDDYSDTEQSDTEQDESDYSDSE